ncbi:FxsB family cyclophane-forming radical SAM/SPASM peptide maturase [Nocardia salmonicida]|uniref:FxsB family cyclophane-forming radical SAM/SPASM peptide maturase n=1 Tax=Nocardia salmonicida TaxID=53431 RepID=UPI003CF320A5
MEFLDSIGWRPAPIRQFLFKIHTRCNLNCDYCYVYEMADQSWRDKPIRMSTAVVDAAARRIGEHARAHGLDEVRVILHGGEPLLAGTEFITYVRDTVTSALPSGTRVSFGMQSNGALIDADIVNLCLELQISVGVSLDGDRAANDRHRLYKNGKSSYDKVLAGIDQLQNSGAPQMFTGILCTIDLTNDPLDTYRSFIDLGAPAIDFLLQHGNWSDPPPGWGNADETNYADWLIPIFDEWFHSNKRPVRIRFFEEIINLLLGGHSQVETIGLTPATLVVIEVNGAIEQVDALKSAYDGAAETGMSVFANTFDEALALPGLAARQIGPDALPDKCRTCPIVRTCGGGYYPHRFKRGSGFHNPSVYCADLTKLIGHINTTVTAAIARRQPQGGPQ